MRFFKRSPLFLIISLLSTFPCWSMLLGQDHELTDVPSSSRIATPHLLTTDKDIIERRSRELTTEVENETDQNKKGLLFLELGHLFLQTDLIRADEYFDRGLASLSEKEKLMGEYSSFYLIFAYMSKQAWEKALDEKWDMILRRYKDQPSFQNTLYGDIISGLIYYNNVVYALKANKIFVQKANQLNLPRSFRFDLELLQGGELNYKAERKDIAQNLLLFAAESPNLQISMRATLLYGKILTEKGDYGKNGKEKRNEKRKNEREEKKKEKKKEVVKVKPTPIAAPSAQPLKRTAEQKKAEAESVKPQPKSEAIQLRNGVFGAITTDDARNKLTQLRKILEKKSLNNSEREEIERIYKESAAEVAEKLINQKDNQGAIEVLKEFENAYAGDKLTKKCKDLHATAKGNLLKKSAPQKKGKEVKPPQNKKKKTQKRKPIIFAPTPSSSNAAPSPHLKEKEIERPEKREDVGPSQRDSEDSSESSLSIAKSSSPESTPQTSTGPSSSGGSSYKGSDSEGSVGSGQATPSSRKKKERTGSSKQRREEEKTQKALKRQQSIASFCRREGNPELEDLRAPKRQSSAYRMIKQLSETWGKQEEDKPSSTAYPLIISSDAIGKRIVELNNPQSKDPLAVSFQKVYKSIEQDALKGEGRPKRLARSKTSKWPEFKKLYRRKLNAYDRVIYTITIPKGGGKAVVEILQIGGHYKE